MKTVALCLILLLSGCISFGPPKPTMVGEIHYEACVLQELDSEPGISEGEAYARCDKIEGK